ncbi:MAG: Rv3235 family protein [Gordonia sp. (in: high G+C Gram-positive bacteria)]|uniref:Rv3235 family protein n=1 Tax=Gordonia sp. (in: high G+C Gram-positive bacteria) TaxID=84139 RepID=UPI0039E4F60C
MRGILLEQQTTAPAPAERPPDLPPDLQIATAARGFAVAALARMLEVLDGRRPRAQLAGIVAGPVLDQVATLLQHGYAAEAQECARLHRVHVQLRSVQSAEYFGSLERAGRVRAFAGRMQRRPARPSVQRGCAERWVVTEFAVL